MALDILAALLEKRRDALVEYCIAHIRKSGASGDYNFVRTPEDLSELLRMDPLVTSSVPNSPVAEATSCTQEFIHAAYRKLERGYEKIEFDKRDLLTWELYSNYPDWAALQMIAVYPENYMSPYVRQRKTSLFKKLESDIEQTALSSHSV